MIFKVRTYRELLQTMIDRIVARSGLTDLVDGSDLKQVVGAAARMGEQIYLETARLLELFSLDRAQGTDLDDRAREYMPDGYERIGETYAVGTLRWTRPVAAIGQAIAIPIGTVVAKSGNGQTATYVTTTEGEILAGGTQSQVVGGGGDIPARAVAAGADGNAAINTVTKAVSSVAGTSGVTNPLPFAGGATQESDDSFKARIRERTRSLSRCIPEALESRVKEAVVSGHRVTVARVIEDAFRRGNVALYVDDGSGGLVDLWATTSAVEKVLNSATGGERYLYTRHKAIRSRTLTVKVNGVVISAPDDYQFIGPWGLIALSEETYPDGLTAGDQVTVDPYTYWTDLVAEAQRLVDGDISDPTSYPCWRAAGVVVRCLPPNVRQLQARLTCAVLDGYNRAAVLTQVAEVLADYVNALNIGEDVIHAELVQRAMDVPGMYDVLFTLPTENVPVADDEVARLLLSNISVE
jgi:uncharacterized phage protein gp47/JayE